MEDQYIREILNGNLSGFSYFVTEYKDMAYSVAFRIVKNREEAEEIVQDSFLRAFKSLHKFRKDSKFSTWFYRIVVNRALSVRTNKKIINKIDIDAIGDINAEQVESVYTDLAKTDREKYINMALAKLPEEDSMLLTLYYLNENSIEEISVITKIKPENIKMRLLRARKKMLLVLENILNHDPKSIL
jgi:RNA polymerase sigma factor (sigma-70 family)